MTDHQRFDLSGQVALVTGGARGIGQGITAALAEHGARVAVVDLATDYQGPATWYYRQDLGQLECLRSLAARAWQDSGGVHILVNNAGTDYLEWFNEITLEHWRHVMAVNLDAVFFLSQAIAERMIANQIAGSIVNISSTNGLVAEAGQAHYNASKGGVEMLTKSLAIELGPFGINVNAIAPGLIHTPLLDELDVDPALIQTSKEHIPLGGDWGRIEDVAGAAVFLASPAARYVTGQHLVVDGGLICDQFPRMPWMPPYRNRVLSGGD